MRFLFVFGSLLLILLSVLWIWDEANPEWKGYQKEFHRLAITKAKSEAEKKSYQGAVYKINQIVIEDIGRVDRCQTCHLGLDDPNFEDAPQPFQAHPKPYLIQHPVEKFGCTICHQGQGLATTVDAAHGEVEYWEEPLLKGVLIQSSCAKCHERESVPEAYSLTTGEKLIKDSGCLGCHKIEQFEKIGKIGNDLSGVGSKVYRKWLKMWLKDPKNYLENPKMPDFKLSDADIDSLVEYLMTLKVEDYIRKNQFKDLSFLKDENLYPKGEAIFRESRCISCHPINSKGGHIWADLGKVASKAKVDWLVSWIKNPRGYQPDTRMPEFRFSDEELKAVVKYIMDEFIDPDNPIDEAEERTAIDPDKVEKGKKLFGSYGCSGCHFIKDRKDDVNVGPELTSIGDRPVEFLDFGKTSNVRRTLPDWLFNKIKNPRIFGTNLKMPYFYFDDEKALDIVTVLLGLTKERLPEEYLKKGIKKYEYDPQGDVGMLIKKYACFTCHRINGRGETLAPDLSIEGSKVKREWLLKYFKVPYSLRPILEERMLNLRMTDEEIKIITDYIMMVLVSDDIPKNFLAGEKDLETLRKEGKQLFEAKYRCSACHIIGLTGGYVGPALTNVGSRLEAGYIFKWLKNPQELIPNVIEPNYGLSDHEAKSLTAYLTSLK